MAGPAMFGSGTCKEIGRLGVSSACGKVFNFIHDDVHAGTLWY